MMPRRRALSTGLVVALLAALAAAVPVAARAAGAPATVHVGTQTLRRCGSAPAAYCGTLQVPLDWQAKGSPDIPVCYRWYPATAGGQADGTVMPVEGGPGYPSIGSVAGAGGYHGMYASVLKHFNMLAVDLRGTGCSTVLNCPKLQNYAKPSGTLAFAAVVGACADALNHRWKFADGSWVHASDLFTSAPAAADLAAVVRALKVPKVDVYGDSYGSWFAQVFAARYPSLTRSVTLDSTYPVQSLDPWYRITIDTMPADFDAVCSHATACAAVGGTSWRRIEALARRLDRSPIAGTVPGPSGKPVHVSMGAEGLVNLTSDATEDPAIYASLDAAARALLDGHQAAPLLRLYASRLAVDEAYFGVPVREYSVELYMAVSCLDYPQLYPLTASPATRRADLRAAEATLPASTFAPFSTKQWLAMDQNTENLTACLDWPKPAIAQPPIAGTPPFLPKNMPVLILGGSLDTWTPPAGVPQVEAEIGGHSRFVEFANETHVVGEYDEYGCASSIIQAFVRDPARLDRINASCAPKVPSLRAVGSFASTLSAVSPVVLTSGSASATARRLAAAAVLTAGDAWSRYESITGSHDTGLYGGTVTAHGGRHLTLTGDELVPGVAVSGTVTITGSDERSTLTVLLTSRAKGQPATRISATWLLYGGQVKAAVTLLSSHGAHLAAGSMPAPEGAPY